jgi:alpha-L-fucosidase
MVLKQDLLNHRPGAALHKSDNKIYIHLVDGKTATLNLENVPVKKIKKAYLLKDKSPVNYTFKKSKLTITTTLNSTEPDQVIVLEIG